MDDFQRKSCVVAWGHMTEVSSSTMFASIVSRKIDQDRIDGGGNDRFWTCRISGHQECIECMLAPKFINAAGKRRSIIAFGGWESCKADHDVWFKAEVVWKGNGYQWYGYCLLYEDNILIVHLDDGEKALHKIDPFFETKAHLIGDPEFYLRASLCPMTLLNSVIAWGMSASKFFQAAVASQNMPFERIPDKENVGKVNFKPFLVWLLCTWTLRVQSIGSWKNLLLFAQRSYEETRPLAKLSFSSKILPTTLDHAPSLRFAVYYEFPCWCCLVLLLCIYLNISVCSISTIWQHIAPGCPNSSRGLIGCTRQSLTPYTPLQQYITSSILF